MHNFFKRLHVSTFSKVVSLVTIVCVCLMILVISLFFYTKAQEKRIFKSSNELYNKEIESLIKLNSELYSSIIVDVTYWTEFVNFIESKNLQWFNTSISPLIDTYKLEYLSAYTADYDFITKVSTLKIKSKIIIPKEAFKRLYERKNDRFYLKIPEGIVEVYGATIHTSDDPFKNKTEPAGYFFMVRLMDDDYFSNIEKICSSNIGFYSGKEKANKSVFKILPLKDYNKNVIGKLYFKRAYNIDFLITKNILLIIAIAIFSSWLVYCYYAIKWSKLPIDLIKKILKENDSTAISSLKNIKGEFRYIGLLFEENKLKEKQLEIAKNKAEESDRLKSAFLMNLSHEVRTPMNAILGFSSLLKDPNLTEIEKKEFIQIIEQSGNNLIEIIDDLVEMSKIDSNLIKPNVEIINLEAVIFSQVKILKVLNTKEHVEFKFNPPEKSLNVNIVTDGVKLKEIISNLVLNAFKFTNKGFVILDCDIDDKNKKVNFTIQDSGVGIPDVFKDNIFKRFTKLSNKEISSNDGLGLGLAISKAYVEMLGGEISFQSQINIGTVFKFSIPFQLASENNFKNIDLESKTPKKFEDDVVILVAEDDNINYLLIEKVLFSFKCKIIRAKDGLEAVNLCKSIHKIDLILMDIRMPNLDGYEAFKQIRTFNKQIPIIAQTSYSFQDELDKINELGFNGFISKPIDKDKLYELIKICLKK
uniref:response regulator n=1 Tax=Flavobacterium sp. TaxID=239 RepID=UPI004049603F